MRWFRGHADAPRLLSLSPLHADEEVEGASLQLHAESRSREMSPVRWARRKSSSSESERNCYNVQTSQVTKERGSQKKDKKRIQEERRRSCEKRNPLLDRVKNTRLSFFRDKDADDGTKACENEEDDGEDEGEHADSRNDGDVADKTQFRSMSELSKRGLTRNEFRRSVCEIDLKEVTEKEKIHTKRKRRCKSQSRLPSRKNNDERFSFLGFVSGATGGSSARAAICNDGKEADSPRESHRRRWNRSRDRLDERVAKKRIDDDAASIEEPIVNDESLDASRYDSLTASSCLAAKFRAMQDRYLKSSTSKLIAKIYRKDAKDRDKRRLRSFSYGTLPGLEELRTNPLYSEQEQDDNDSGILDNGSATSSLLDDRCGSGASGSPTIANDRLTTTIPPQLPPRGISTPVDKKWLYDRAEPKLDPEEEQFREVTREPATRIHEGRSAVRNNIPLGIDTRNLCSARINEAANEELINRKARPGGDPRKGDAAFERRDERLQGERDHRDVVHRNDDDKLSKVGRLSVVRSRSYTTETSVVKLARESGEECLGIFIAKTTRSSPGYLVAHVVPNGLADREGTLRIGDEILIVNGKRLRGLSMAEARTILGNGSGPGEVDIVISRKIGVDSPKKLKESSVDYENVCVENGHINNNNNINNNNIIDDNLQKDCPGSPKSHFRKNNSRHHRDRKNESNRSICSDKRSLNPNDTGQQTVSNFCTLPRRPRSTVSTFHTVVFEKGHGKKSLGFTIVGGRDSPKGSIGIFIKSVLPGGQAAEDGRLRAGDEILAVNGQVSHDLTHREAVQLFRNIKSGSLALHICRRARNRDTPMPKAKSCADLLLVDA